MLTNPHVKVLVGTFSVIVKTSPINRCSSIHVVPLTSTNPGEADREFSLIFCCPVFFV